jgi:hypothetical protein
MAVSDSPFIRKLVLGASLSFPGMMVSAQQEPQKQITAIPEDDKTREALVKMLTEKMFEAFENKDVEKAKQLIIQGADITSDKDDIYPLRGLLLSVILT